MDRSESVIGPEMDGKRLDVALSGIIPGVSRSVVQKMIQQGVVLRNGTTARSKETVHEGDIITWGEYTPPAPSADPEQIPIDLVYEDDAIIVVNKPRGMATHPAPGTHGGTLVNALLGRGKTLSLQDDELRPGIVHRLDKDTTGLLVVAKTNAAHASLAEQIAERSLRRTYIALVWGVPRWRHARVDAPIGRHPTQRDHMAVLAPDNVRGKVAVTDFDVLETFGSITLIRAQLHTGRTHQIRVHASYAGHPVIGDEVYGGIRPAQVKRLAPDAQKAILALSGQALHAVRLAFAHPATGASVAFEAPPPREFLGILKSLDCSMDVDELLTAVRCEAPPALENE